MNLSQKVWEIWSVRWLIFTKEPSNMGNMLKSIACALKKNPEFAESRNKCVGAGGSRHFDRALSQKTRD